MHRRPVFFVTVVCLAVGLSLPAWLRAGAVTPAAFGRLRFSLPGRWDVSRSSGGGNLLVAKPAGVKDFAVFVFGPVAKRGRPVEDALAQVRAGYERTRTPIAGESMAAPRRRPSRNGEPVAFQRRVTSDAKRRAATQYYFAFDLVDQAQVVCAYATSPTAAKRWGPVIEGALCLPLSECGIGRSITVMPIFVVPRGERPPTEEQKSKYQRYMEWTQRRWAGLLRGHTFRLTRNTPYVSFSRHSLAEFQKMAETGVAERVAELFAEFGVNRFNCPYIFASIVHNVHTRWPAGAGRPFNCGVNTGGGLLHSSTVSLEKGDGFQSTLEHEIGHSLGLTHVEDYGYPMDRGISMMSFNQRHVTDGFRPAPEPAGFNPEDLRALGRCWRTIPGFRFDPARDVPAGYKISGGWRYLGTQVIPGQPSFTIEAKTKSGETFGSNVRFVVQGMLEPSPGPGNTYNAYSMWHSGLTDTGWVSVDLDFPVIATLDTIWVHSQHSGQYHPATAVRVHAVKGGRPVLLVQRDLAGADAPVSFPPTRAKQWRLDFRATDTRYVVIRGLRFFDGDAEVIPRDIDLLDHE